MRYITTAEAARRLAISTNRMKYLADRGELPVIRTKAGWRLYREQDVERLLRRRHRVGPQPRTDDPEAGLAEWVRQFGARG